MTGSDDESKPMTRTELAMLWDLLGVWDARHPFGDAGSLRDEVDAELTERYGS